MANTDIEIRALLAAAGDIGEASGITAESLLKQVRQAIVRDNITSGKVLVSTGEGGGTVTFALPAGHTPRDLLTLVQSAIDRLAADGPRPLRRLRASFSRAYTS